MKLTFSIKECISFGWKTFMARPWLFVGTSVIYVLIQMMLGWAQGSVHGLPGAIYRDGHPAFAPSNPGRHPLAEDDPGVPVEPAHAGLGDQCLVAPAFQRDPPTLGEQADRVLADVVPGACVLLSRIAEADHQPVVRLTLAHPTEQPHR